MPAPATVEELLDLVQKSGVSDEGRLKAYAQKLTEQVDKPTDPGKLAGQLVRDGLLTYFQAEQLLQGKWKRFNIGKYRVLERLGAGGMGQVFLCEHKFMRRRVAVKVLPTAKASDPASLERFYREAKAIAAVDHPNIVRAFDIDQDDNLHFLVMEYVDGTNLADLVKKSGPLDVLRACHYIYGSAVGLQHAHEVGLVHRDIKPGNILIDRSGVVKILDMGLARFFHDEDDNLTKKYDENVLGTADYLAPEQALESHSVDIRADIYSLGAMFYYLLTGSALFPEGSVAQKLIWHQTRVPRSVQSLRPEVPDAVVALLDRMTAKDPSQRYQTPAEVMAALAPWVASPISPPAENELPHLSPAALGAGGQGIRAAAMAANTQTITRFGGPIGSAPPTFAGSAPPTNAQSWSEAPASVGRPTVTTLHPVPISPPTEPGSGGVWENMSAETQDAHRSDTDRAALATGPQTAAESEKAAALLATPARTVPLWAYISAAVGLASVSAILVYLFVLRAPSPPTPPTHPGESPRPEPNVPRAKTWIVSNAGGDGVFPTLRHALPHVRPGDTIQIKDESTVEPSLRVGGPAFKDVTIESNLPASKSATIVFDGGSGSASMIEIIQTEGLKLRNLTFDGKDVANLGIVLTGSNPGVQLESLTIRNVKTAAIRLKNISGTAQKPVVLDRLWLKLEPGTEAGILAEVNPDQVAHNLVIRRCRIEGMSPPKKGPPLAKVGIRFDGPMEGMEVAFNRLYNVTYGVVFGPLADNAQSHIRLTNNTFHSMKSGLFFDFPVSESRGRFDLIVEKNYFARTDAVARHKGQSGSLSGVYASINVRDKFSNESTVPLQTIAVGDYEMPRPGRDADDVSFLRYPLKSVLGKGVGANKDRVGYYAE